MTEQTDRIIDRKLTAAAVILLSGLLSACGGGASPESRQQTTNRAPVAVDDIALQNGGAINIAVLANDRDPDGDSISLDTVSAPGNGTTTINDNGTSDAADDFVTYTPDGGYGGNDSFTYSISDASGLNATATVSVVATSTAPIANSDDASTAADTPVSIFVLANDSDPNGLALNLVSVTTPANGVASINDNGTPADGSDDYVNYGPSSGFSGSDSFSYTVNNGAESASASVNVIVGGSGSAGVSGDVTKGPISGAVIRLYRIDGSGLPVGGPVAQTATNAQGKWTVAVPLPRESLLVVSEGGQYIDETDSNPDISMRRVIQLGATDQLEAVMPAADDYLSLNLYTNAMLLKSRAETTVNEFDQVYATNRGLMSQATGFDPLTTAPTDPGNPNPAASEAAKKYALLLGGAANVLNAVIQGTGQNTVGFNVIGGFISDMQDCRLDGVNPGGPAQYLFLGAQRNMPADIDLNLEITRFRNNNFARYAGISASIDQTVCSQSGAVPDTLAPVITLLGANPLTFEGGGVYTDAGFSALDDRDGDVSANVSVSGNIDTSVVGTQTLTFSVSDAAGNVGTAARTVNVVDTTPPLLTLNGTSPVTVLVNTSYTDSLGANAIDAVDGDLTSAIVSVNPVDISTPGNYVITYDVTDSSGNTAAQITRTVSVVDTENPVITLNGNSPQTHEAGTPYVDAGATANDAPDGDITASIVTVNNVNSAMVGSYTVTYDVTDSSGNPATQVVRIVNVTDSTLPVITLAGANPQAIEAPGAYTELGATASDSLDGDITASIVIDASAVDTSTPGSYVVTYDVMDTAGNAATQVTRTVTVQDTTPPVITLTGANPQNVEANTAYTELGASASDTLDGDLTAGIVIDTTAVDPATPGSYVVTYDVMDAAGNAATQVTRTVNVQDTTPPVITLLGSPTVTIAENAVYTDAGASASDTLDGDLSGAIVTVNPVDTTVPGDYTVRYDVSDAAGNAAATVMRMVTVTPVNDAPILSTSIGDQMATEWATFSLDISAFFIDPDGDPLSFSLTGLPMGSGLSLDPDTGLFAGTPNVSDAEASPMTLTVTASDPSLESASDSFALSVAPVVDVDIDIIVDEYVPAPGTSITYTISLQNLATLAATNIEVNDPEPAGITFGVAVPSVGTWDAATNTWHVPSLAGGAILTLDIPAVVDAATPAGTVISNQATKVAQDQIDPDPSDIKSVEVMVLGPGSAYSWLGGDGGGPSDWLIPANWSPAGIPSINDTVTIPDGAPFYPILTGDVQVKKIEVKPLAQLQLNGRTLDVAADTIADGVITGPGLVRVKGGALKGNFPELEIAGSLDLSGTVNVAGNFLLSAGNVHVSAETINVTGNFVASGTGVLLMHHGTDVLNVSGDVTFSGGDTATQVDGAAPMRDGTLFIGGNFVQNGDPRSFAPEDKFRIVFNGGSIQTVVMNNPDLSNPDPGTPAATGSRFSRLEIQKNGAGDGAVVFLTDVAVLLDLRSLPDFLPILQGTGTNKVMAGGVHLENLIFDNLALEVLAGGDLGLVADLLFRNMNPAVIQLAVRRPDFTTAGLNIFTRLDFLTLPDITGGGAYIELENTETVAPMSLSLTVTSSLPEHGSPWSRTVGDFVLNWGTPGDDTDGDGVTDAEEFSNGLDPRDSDWDDDGLSDGQELFSLLTDPKSADTDGDGIGDGVEFDIGANPVMTTNNVYYMDAIAGDDANGGSSWADALQSNGAMFGAGGPLETLNGTASEPVYVLYAAGTYDSLTLLGRNDLVLAGSLGPGAARARAFIDSDFDGADANRVVDLDNSNSITFKFLRLTNGRSNGGPDASGGGLRVAGTTGSSALLQNVEITDNFADRNGGGFFVDAGSSLTILGAYIARNTARGRVGSDWGGGGGSAFGTLTLEQSVIARNAQIERLDAAIGGGGLVLRPAAGDAVAVTENLIVANSAQSSGGGVFVDQPQGSIVLKNNLIVGNVAVEDVGGGVALGSISLSAPVFVESNTVAYNQILTRSDAGGGIDLAANAVGGEVRNNIVWSNDDGVLGRVGSDNFFDHGSGVLVEFNNLQNDPTGGAGGNIDWIPRFRSGFYLQNGSKSVDAGSTSATAAGLGAPFTTDTSGSPDGGILDHGFHYREGAGAAADAALVTAETADCATATYSVFFAPMAGSVDLGSGHTVEVRLAAGHTAGGSLEALTSLQPYDNLATVLAVDEGNGVYSISVSGVSFSAGETVVLEVRIDGSGGSPLIITSPDLEGVFLGAGC